MPDIDIIEFCDADVAFLLRCFSSLEWRRSYGLCNEDVKVEEIVKRRIEPYPYVKRFVFRKKGKVFAFATVDFKDAYSQSCVVVGGVDPRKVGSGLGVKVAVILFEFLFQKFPVNCIEAIPQNNSSSRMLARIGFEKLEQLGRGERVKVFLLKRDFPNEFCSRVLDWMRHEAR